MASRVGEFHDAVYRGDVALASSMAESEPALLTSFDPGSFRASAMNSAARGGSFDSVDFLIENGVSPDLGSDWWAGSFSPLITAIHQGDRAMTEHLISRGATVTAYEAAAMGDRERLRGMLEADPTQVHFRGGDGQQPLHAAANPEVARLLLQHGADIEARCVDHESTPLQYANDRPEVAEALLESGAQGDIFAWSVTPNTRWLAEALAKNPAQASQPYLRSDFPCRGDGLVHIYTFTIGDHAQPIHAAAMRSNIAGLRMLAAHGADVNARGGYDDATPLHCAAWCDASSAIPVLLELGAELDAPSGSAHRNSALGWAIVAGSLASVERLLAAGAQVRESHRAEAEAGAGGAFQRLKRAPQAARDAIEAMVLAAG